MHEDGSVDPLAMGDTVQEFHFSGTSKPEKASKALCSQNLIPTFGSGPHDRGYDVETDISRPQEDRPSSVTAV